MRALSVGDEMQLQGPLADEAEIPAQRNRLTPVGPAEPFHVLGLHLQGHEALEQVGDAHVEGEAVVRPLRTGFDAGLAIEGRGERFRTAEVGVAHPGEEVCQVRGGIEEVG